MKYIWVILLPSFAFGACDIPNALQTLTPKAVWNLSGDQYSGITWLDTIQVQPTLAQVSQAISACQANQVQLQVYQVELSTTQASLVGATTNYISSTVLGQVKINAKLVRIQELKALLGIQ